MLIRVRVGLRYTLFQGTVLCVLWLKIVCLLQTNLVWRIFQCLSVFVQLTKQSLNEVGYMQYNFISYETNRSQIMYNVRFWLHNKFILHLIQSLKTITRQILRCNEHCHFSIISVLQTRTKAQTAKIVTHFWIFFCYCFCCHFSKGTI